jgi:Putative zinc ribbon domain
MNKKCTSCNSCGMPLEKATDYALGCVSSQYCTHCTDDKGNLKPYSDVLQGMAGYLVESQGINRDKAQTMAQDLLSRLPAWQSITS